MIIFPLKLYTRVLLCTRMSVGVERVNHVNGSMTRLNQLNQ